MSTNPDPREGKLPKWAQTMIGGLRRDLSRVRDDFEEYADEVTVDETVAVANPYDTHPRPVLREGENLRLLLDGVDGYRWVDVKPDPDGRSVSLMGSAGLVLKPHVTNHITISLDRN